MTTTAQKFFLGIVDDDQTGGTTIKKIQETAPTTTSTTTNTWTVVAPQTRTHVPLAASSVASDTSDVNAWDFNNGGADGLGSTATAKRWIKAGVWNFSMSYTLNAPATLQTIACTVTARVYRVATGGGTRTLLFTAASANFSATGVQTWNSASQPEYVLESGEVIQVGFTAVSGATQPVALNIVNTVLTLNLGADSWFQVPTPGVRTLGEGAGASAGIGAALGVGLWTFTGVGASSGIGAATGVGLSTGAGIAASSGVGAASGVGAPRFSGVGSSAGIGAVTGVGLSTFSGIGSSSGVGAAAGVGLSRFAGVGSSAGVGAALAAGNWTFSGVGLSAGVGTATGFGSSLSATVGNAAGVGAATGRITKVLGAVGTVDIGGEGGGTTITYIRPIILL